MDQKKLKKGAWAAGGVALLAVTSALCVKGLKVVNQKLKAKKKAKDIEETEAELFDDVAETEAAEETVEKTSVEEIIAEEKAEDSATAA